MTELQVQDKAGKNIKTGLMISLALLVLVELVIVGFWISYLTQSNQGLLSVGIICKE